MTCLQFTLALLLFSFSVSNGQFQKMFGQQTVLDGHPGASDGKILIKSELDIKTTYLPEDCTIVTKTGDTITLEYDVCSFLFSVTVSPNVTSAYDAYVNDEHKETSKETEGMPAGLLEFTIGKRMVVLGLDIGVVGMCTGEKRSIKIPPQLAWGEKGIPGIIPANAMARFDIELVKIQGQSWADWYVEILQIVCGICFAAGAIALLCEKIREKKGGKKSK
ncbi:uncharacterized protein LOC143054354 isoform X2 [Mytilus galloprovincialis]|uniref:uncharacterized protein LOC143054354 isoform X2 n=1 Tax=Mytilus galloprovincialis TaxID=29158 RepID=UPI003F7CB7E9